MNESAYRTPFVLITVLTILLLVSCFASIFYAAFTTNRSTTGDNVAVVGTLKSSVSAGTITVQNDMDCVLRVSPLVSGLTFSTTEWFKQDNGWYYYYRVINKADSNKTITLTGATAENVKIELMQAQYLIGTNTIKAGFLREWASRDISITDANDVDLFGDYTIDGIDLTDGGNGNATDIVLFSGRTADGIVESDYDAGNMKASRFKATKTSDYYAFNKINLSSGTTYSAIGDSNKLSLYNNTNIPVVYMIQVVNGSGEQPTKDSVFSNGNWTTYVKADGSSSFVKATSSSATSYTTYFVSKSASPGEYIDLTNGSDNKLYFGSTTDTETSISLMVMSVDVTTFVYKYDSTATSADNYLAWLKSLDTNKTGSTFYNDFIKIFE